jgi:hypothetical protein
MTHQTWGLSMQMTEAGFHSLAKLRAQMCTADRGNPRWLDRGLPRMKWPYCGVPQTVVWIWEWIATGLTWPDVIHATWARSLAIRSALESGLPRGYGKPQYLSVEQVSEFQYPPFYIDSFPVCWVASLWCATLQALRRISGGLFRPTQYINGLSLSHYRIYHVIIPLMFSSFN